MRCTLLLLSLFGILALAHATSYFFTLEQKVAASKAIVRVSVTEVLKTYPTTLKARVLETLKGPADLTEIEFQYHAEESASRKLPEMIGQEYYVFLHQPSVPGAPENQWWVFQGHLGIRPIADLYHERHLSPNREFVDETYSRSNFVAAIRAFAEAGLTNRSSQQPRRL